MILILIPRYLGIGFLLEKKIQKLIISYLEDRDWMVKSTHGGAFQDGFPDLYCTHAKYGVRWVEVKRPLMVGSVWTKAQRRDFPPLVANGTDIWILTGNSLEEYKKLFKPMNLWDYMDVTKKNFKRKLK